MKLTLLLVTCLVGVSYQQRYIWHVPYGPRAHYTPLYYADGLPAGYDLIEPSIDKVYIIYMYNIHQC